MILFVLEGQFLEEPHPLENIKEREEFRNYKIESIVFNLSFSIIYNSISNEYISYVSKETKQLWANYSKADSVTDSQLLSEELKNQVE